MRKNSWYHGLLYKSYGAIVGKITGKFLYQPTITQSNLRKSYMQ
jgi:hypothetical protein